MVLLIPFLSKWAFPKTSVMKFFIFPLGYISVSLLTAFMFSLRRKPTRQMADSLWAKTLQLQGACLPEGWTQFTAALLTLHFVNKCIACSWLDEKWNSVRIPKGPQVCVRLTGHTFVSLRGHYIGETLKSFYTGACYQMFKYFLAEIDFEMLLQKILF